MPVHRYMPAAGLGAFHGQLVEVDVDHQKFAVEIDLRTGIGAAEQHRPPRDHGQPYAAAAGTGEEPPSGLARAVGLVRSRGFDVDSLPTALRRAADGCGPSATVKG
jgi:hypothetical protein